MGSHPKTFHRIRFAGDDTKNASCDVNSQASIVAMNTLRGTHPSKIQHWEVLLFPASGTVQFRNIYSVFLGVDSITNSAPVGANTGVDQSLSYWKLQAEGAKFKIILNSSPADTTYYMNLNGTNLELSTTASLWDIQVSDGVPPSIMTSII